MSEMAAITESMLAAMDGYIARAVAPFKEKIAALEKRIAEFPAPEKGDKGEPGKDFDPELITLEAARILPCMVDRTQAVLAERLEAAIAALPKPRDGEPGKDAVVDVDALVSRVNEIVMQDIDEAIIVHANSAVARIPVPRDGEPGKDADPEEVSNLIAEKIRSAILPEMIEKALAALPKTKDGEPGKDAAPAVSVTFGSINADGHLLLGMSDGKCIDVGMVKGERGKDGEPGSVALGDHTVWGLDATRSYPKGTWAIHGGALLHAKRATGPIADGIEAAGWEPAFEVPQDWSMELGDDMRTFTARAVTASGMRLVMTKRIPVILDQELWQAKAYEKGDAVTYDSSLWIARRDTTARPGESDDWRLAARKGRDGRNADGSRATVERGPVRLK